jgi:GT2 family glycosyltransferase
MTPHVSILALTYNRIELTSKHLPSVIRRIGKIDHEVLIWDNGSTDGSYDWLCQYAQTDPSVSKIFGSDKNIGMEAFNFLAAESSGKYILKIDDDISVPDRFAERLVAAFERVNEPKLAFLGWDMWWPSPSRTSKTTFATRSGLWLYEGTNGKTINLGKSERVYIHYDPARFMVNGVCRLSLKQKFFDLGGHPKGLLYGVDRPVSKAAADNGMWIGYYNCNNELIAHHGGKDTQSYRQLKNKELHRTLQI